VRVHATLFNETPVKYQIDFYKGRVSININDTPTNYSLNNLFITMPFMRS